MVVIKDLNEQYTELSHPPTKDFEPPFDNEDPETCWETLYEMVERTKSDLDTEHFAIIDERSLKDASALLVVNRQDDKSMEIKTVRVDLKLVSLILSSWSAKGSNVSELTAKAAKSSDGVCRW